jgi:hypothetical protein
MQGSAVEIACCASDDAGPRSRPSALPSASDPAGSSIFRWSLRRGRFPRSLFRWENDSAGSMSLHGRGDGVTALPIAMSTTDSGSAAASKIRQRRMIMIVPDSFLGSQSRCPPASCRAKGATAIVGRCVPLSQLQPCPVHHPETKQLRHFQTAETNLQDLHIHGKPWDG